MSTALMWFRRDLRLADQPGLLHALAHYDNLVPVYIHAPHEEAPWSPGAASRWWLHHSLHALAADLASYGSRLIIRQGNSLETLQTLLKETQAQAVYWHRLYEPALTKRDQAIQTALQGQGIAVYTDNAALLVEPWSVQRDGEPYKVFTPFWKACLRRWPFANPSSRPQTLKPPSQWPTGFALTDLALLPRIRWDTEMVKTWQPGEQGAQRRLAEFVEHALTDYSIARNQPALDGVSRLSPHLHFGEISPRQIVSEVQRATADHALEQVGAEHYLRELGWREFAHHVLHHWPHTPDQPLQPRFERYPWRGDYEALLTAWQQGRTGYPLVDAGMRQLWATGWMHNRTRMLVASLLTKNCRIPWQEGARWFWETLVDADLANNTLGWQWTAGCGTDAAPYFRIFNPMKQGEQYDPKGIYVRRWVPELAQLPDRWVHQPWALLAAEQRLHGFTPGVDYPLPILDFATSRAEALAGYEVCRSDSGHASCESQTQ